jgi:predicted amidophosphoribosyltransferase
MVGSWKTFLLRLLYPPKCPGCGCPVHDHGVWCPQCLASIWQPRLLTGSRQAGALDGCYCLADYRGSMQKVLQGLKFSRRLKYEAACLYLLDKFPWRSRLASVHMVVPVPLSAQRLQDRGFNQTEIIFRNWAERYWCWQEALVRVKMTKPQWGLNRQERQSNIKRVFAVEGSLCIQNKHILLVEQRCSGLIQYFKWCA